MAAAVTAQLDRLALSRQAAGRVVGRVGNRPSREFLVTTNHREGRLHIRCLENPEFWLDFDLRTQLAMGYMEMAGMRHVHGGHAFAVLCEGDMVCVYHSACAAFWLEIAV